MTNKILISTYIVHLLNTIVKISSYDIVTPLFHLYIFTHHISPALLIVSAGHATTFTGFLFSKPEPYSLQHMYHPPH